MTRDERREFLLGRRGIGASQAAAALGYSPYDTPAQVYDEVQACLAGEIDHLLDAPSKAAERGIFMEPHIADLYAEETGFSVYKSTQAQHPKYQFLFANPDYDVHFVVDGTPQEDQGIMEAKCPGIWIFSEFLAYGLSDAWNIQGQLQLECRPDAKWLDYAILNCEKWQLEIFRVYRDAEFLEKIVDLLAEWYHEHIFKNVRPTETERAKLEIPEYDGQVALVEDPYRKLADLLFLAKYEEKQAGAVVKAVKVKFGETMLDADQEAIEVPGLIRAYYKQQNGRLTIDKPKLEAALREAGLDPADYWKRGEPFFTFKSYDLSERQ